MSKREARGGNRCLRSVCGICSRIGMLVSGLLKLKAGKIQAILDEIVIHYNVVKLILRHEPERAVM